MEQFFHENDFQDFDCIFFFDKCSFCKYKLSKRWGKFPQRFLYCGLQAAHYISSNQVLNVSLSRKKVLLKMLHTVCLNAVLTLLK